MLICTGLIASSVPAIARAPVNEWFCNVLQRSFDPVAAIATFPLEKLPPAVETRKVKADEEENRTRTSVKVTSEGEHFTVEYSYAFRSDNVSDPYGFDLTVDANFPQPDGYAEQTAKWLAEFGKEERSSNGRSIYAGPEIYKGGDPVFSFARSPVTGSYAANWWSRSDIRYAAEFCK